MYEKLHKLKRVFCFSAYQAGKLEELTHEMVRYHWNLLGLCEMRWKNFGEMSSDDRHKV